MKLSSTYVKALKIDRKDKYCSRAERGLHVVVYPSGAKVWRFRYNLDGKRRHIRVGEFPAIDADKAHSIAMGFREQVKSGIDPTEQRDADKAALTLERAKRVTLQRLFDDYIADAKRSGMKSHEERSAVITRDFLGTWGILPVQDIDRSMIKSRLNEIERRGPVARNRAHSYFRAVLSYAVVEGILTENPASNIKQTKEQTRKRALDIDEITWFWLNLCKSGCSRLTQIALQLTLITGQRPGEVVAMEQKTIKGGWWTIPGSVTKNGIDQRVYLTPLVKSLIDEATGLSASKKHVFVLRGEQHIHQHALPKAVSRWRAKKEFTIEDFTPHDLRRTMLTGLGRLGVSRFIQDRIANHKDGTIAGVYDVHSYDDEKQAAWECWDAELQAALRGSDV